MTAARALLLLAIGAAAVVFLAGVGVGGLTVRCPQPVATPTPRPTCADGGWFCGNTFTFDDSGDYLTQLPNMPTPRPALTPVNTPNTGDVLEMSTDGHGNAVQRWRPMAGLRVDDFDDQGATRVLDCLTHTRPTPVPCGPAYASAIVHRADAPPVRSMRMPTGWRPGDAVRCELAADGSGTCTR